MIKTFQRLTKDSLVYGVGSAATKLIAFLLIPLYTRFLTTDDYGVMSNVLVLFPLVADVANLSIISAFYRFYFTSNRTQNILLVTSTSWHFNLFSSAAFLSLLFLGSPIISQLFTGSPANSLYFQLATISLFFDNLNRTGLAIFRVQRRTKLYVTTIIFQTTLYLLLNIYFVAGLHLGLIGILLGQLIATLVVTIVLIPLVIFKEISLRFSFQILREMLSFSIPLIPINLSAWTINSAAVPLLAHLSSLTESGLYSMGYKFGSIVSLLVVAPFQLGWTPIAYSLNENPDRSTIYSRVLTYFTFVAVFVSLGVSVLSKDVLRIISTPEFYRAYKPVFLISMAFVLHGVLINFAVIINIRMKTHWNSVLWVIGALTSIVLYFALIPALGMVGAGTATVIAYLIIVIFGHMLVQKLFPLEYEYSRLAKLFGVGIGLYLISLFINIESVWASIAFNLAIACCYPLVLGLLGFYKKEEWTRVISTLKNIRPLAVVPSSEE